MEKTKIGLVGCGNISGIYLQNCGKMFRNLEIVAVADQVIEKAEARAKEFGIARILSVEEMLAESDIKIILNLTIPKSHYQVSKAALLAGKSVYVEKPLALTLVEGEELAQLAEEKGLRIASAPDTFLGAGIQTCRKLIDDGWLGDITGGAAFMLCGGHESWHPDPEFYYQAGGGPLFDMGPYYLHALINLLGAVSRVSGSVRASQAERTITSSAKYGKIIPVEVATHTTAILDFESKAIVTLVTSFDVPGGSTCNPIEIWGSKGSLQVPDPNTFGAPVRFRKKGSPDWSEIPLLFDNAENSRGLGLSDLAQAIQAKRVPRVSKELGLHCLEIMTGILQSSDNGSPVMMKHPCSRPQAL